jgi:hypothetical protein
VWGLVTMAATYTPFCRSFKDAPASYFDLLETTYLFTTKPILVGDLGHEIKKNCSFDRLGLDSKFLAKF